MWEILRFEFKVRYEFYSYVANTNVMYKYMNMNQIENLNIIWSSDLDISHEEYFNKDY